MYLHVRVVWITAALKISNFTIEHTRKSNEKLNFSINFKNNEVLDKVKESSSKKIVCKNTANNNQMLDAYIDKIENNKIDVSVEFCSNNNRSCEPIDISSVKKINLECQAIFSAMIGNVSKSEKFPIVWEEK
ncbi:hypothetical protein [Acinetobacter nosocomialis]|uniref:hypothetical protein n=1 Tax=Acinetobacter nosocomialis TaxID=106654 RepID=UPI002A371368|nr:hypothetical protein [Acinetobacter nosocomialis]